MKKAIALADKALDNGNPPVGALLVLDNGILGEGIESGKTTNNITNHAEILAIQDAIENGFLDKLAQSTLYTTHEPCLMCSYAIRHHRIGQIVFGVSVSHVGGYSSEFKLLNTENIPKWGKKPIIIDKVLTEECQLLSERYEARQKRGDRTK